MNVATRPTIYGISLCSGVGMLDEGVKAALEYLGFDYRTVCYVERDSYAAAALVARMEGKALDQALVWDDLTTFPGRAFRGRVHSIAAGFPCQDISLAGQRKGLDGERSGLFFTILDIADDCEAPFLFLENVAGIASATATVVHEAEELDERAAARVLGELADRGWDAEWLHLLATRVGTSHRRERWFCFAWRRLANTQQQGPQERGCEPGNTGEELAATERDCTPFFAPGPADPRWPDILAEHPELAPAIESSFCGMVNGVATRLDEHRADRLRCGGNGVVALQAAAAFVELIRRARQ